MNAVPTICYPYVGREVGGSHISSLGLIKNLDPGRYKPIIVLQYGNGPMYDLFRDEGLQPIVSPPISDLPPPGAEPPVSMFLKAVRALPGLTRFLKTSGAKIVHGNDGRTNAFWGAPAKLAGLKLVWHNRGNPRAKGLRLGAPLIADQVLSVSHFASPAPGPLSAASKNKVVYSPFDTDLDIDRGKARASIIEELKAPEDTKFVGYFGWMIDRKRPLLFVDAIAELKRQHPDQDTRGLMFGEAEPEMMERVKARIEERGVSDNVALMGFRKPGAAWIAGCDALAVPAVEEPFGRTLIEAMLTGTPVIATRSGGNPEAITDRETGVIVAPENAQALAEGIWSVISSPDYAKALAGAARTDAKRRFGINVHAEAVMQVYDNLVGGA